MNPLELHGVTKRYPGFTLDAVDLVVPRGYVMGLVGANGAGKTTAIKCALGMVRPDVGDIALLPKERIGVVLDITPYPPDWTINTVARALAPFYPRWDAAAFARHIAAADIAPTKKVKELSRGMSVRLQLAVALSHGAEFLILDEPTSGLDPFARDQFVGMIADFMTNETHSVLFSTHITTDLDKIADYITVLANGRVASSSTKDDLIDGYRIVRGRTGELSPELRASTIWLREHAAGWDALVATEHTASLPAGTVAEAPSIEDVIVRTVKEHRHA